ncbi:hypothetical protein Zm00014a_033852 [Zea mays]|uniref:Uncharacterized protein n=1 Tax=Zea mays TaxID=4577 RepID=A0A3L6DBK2_MAIZE|nr:hypothetical protein Zm00014a_033852 [Zea mays]
MAARRAMAARSSYAYIELRSGTQAILVAVNKLASELSFYQRKAWLDPVNLLSGKSSYCGFCGEPLQFVLQWIVFQREVFPVPTAKE